MSPVPTSPPSDPAPSLRPVEELQALCDAATDGPWEIISTSVCRIYGPDARMRRQVVTPSLARVDRPDDAAFIAAARTALPALLARLRAAEETLAAVGAIASQIEAESSYSGSSGRVVGLAVAADLRAALAEGASR